MIAKGKSQADSLSPSDGGYSWVILAAVVLQCILMGIQYAPLGVFIVEWVEYFNYSQAAITSIATCSYSTGYLSGKTT